MAAAAKQRTSQTAKKRAKLLEVFADTGNISRACEAAGVGRATHYEWVDKVPDYAKAVEAAHEIAGDSLEAEARRRAMAGSDVLLIFLLKGNKPGKFADRKNIDHTTGGEPIKVIMGATMDEV